MKVLFAGPSLYSAEFDLGDIILKSPAMQGDLAQAVEEGASAIGLVDGLFEAVAAVWHKEILYALSKGVRVFGAASMGALRAAECAPFGMEPVGVISERYISGELNDDAAVAQIHGPAEIGFMPLTETLVDAEATIERLLSNELISVEEADALNSSARQQFFKERTAKSIVFSAAGLDPLRKDAILGAYSKFHRSLKSEDAILLVDALRACPPGFVAPPDWDLEQPMMWRRVLSSVTSPTPNQS